MGSRSKPELHPRVAEWGESFRGVECLIDAPPRTGLLKEVYDFELKEYFRLCCLARSKTADRTLAERAHQALFPVRVALERSMATAIDSAPCSDDEVLDALFSASFFGCSKKQGTSLRMPLATCTPTALCAGGCYAHDVLDAAPNAMVRGVINGWIARRFEEGSGGQKGEILSRLEKHTKKAVRHALRELDGLPTDFSRRAFIRFSHVGEITRYPAFANALAEQVAHLSDNLVDCVIYTRHKNAKLLNPDLWIINFTLDPVSLEREAWAPEQARLVFSAFGGETSPRAEVNFLEHHRHLHLERSTGEGRICPATLPETEDRTCDGCRCNRCFVPPRPKG